MTTVYRADIVGSLLRPEYLVRARTQFEAGEMAPAAYKQIEANLRSKIGQGHWPVGAMLPSRRDLAKEYGVSPITVERAVTRLLADGILRALAAPR